MLDRVFTAWLSALAVTGSLLLLVVVVQGLVRRVRRTATATATAVHRAVAESPSSASSSARAA